MSFTNLKVPKEGTNMNKCKVFPKLWFLVLLFVAFVAGCAGNAATNDNETLDSPKAINCYALEVGGIKVAGIINETAKTIAVTVPYNTPLAALIAFYKTTGVSVKVGTLEQSNGATPNNFTNPVLYTVTGADGKTATYTVTVIPATNSAKALGPYSLDVNGVAVPGAVNETAKTILVTVPYGTPVTGLVATYTTTGTVPVRVNGVAQTSGTTPNDFSNPMGKPYTVTAADGTTATYTVTVFVAASSAKAIAPYSIGGVAGTINEADKTIVVTMPFGTIRNGQIATFGTTGAGLPTVGGVPQTSGTTPNDFTTPKSYIVTAADGTTTTYTVTVPLAPNSAKALGPYSLNGVEGAVNEAAGTISVTMPFGTDRNGLIATFGTTGAGVPTVGGVNQLTGATPNDFRTSKTYIVTAADGTTKTYTVTVTNADGTAKVINTYTLAGVPGTIDQTAKTITVTLPAGTDVRNLPATFTSTGFGFPTVGGVNQVNGTTPHNFTIPVTYRVYSADGTFVDYIVTVIVPVPVPVVCIGASCVSLGAANNLTTAAGYAIFSDTGITNVPTSNITGNMGTAAAATSITGFALDLPAASPFSTSAQVNGKVYANNYAVPTPANMTAASTAMGAAYVSASTRTVSTPATTYENAASGNIIPTTSLPPGVYHWSTNVTIPLDITITGSATDVWIFNVDGTLAMTAGKTITLSGGALPQNIFWRVAGAVSIGAASHFEGIVLGFTSIDFLAGSSIHGRLLSQTGLINLQSTTVTQP
jgi:Ice-binding-like